MNLIDAFIFGALVGILSAAIRIGKNLERIAEILDRIRAALERGNT